MLSDTERYHYFLEDLRCYTVVLFDDFNNRQHYHIVLDFFEIIEKGSKMVVLKKKYTAGKYERKKLMKKCNELIKKYQTDPR